MQLIGVVLVLINIVTIVGPVAAVTVSYQDNLTELVVPPQMKEIVEETLSSEEPVFTLPTLVDYQVDTEARTVTLIINFTNPLNYDLNLTTFSADIQCTEHKFILGHASIPNELLMQGKQSTLITVEGFWTQEAETHFQTEHAGDKTIDVEIVNINVNVNGITIEPTDPIKIPNIPIA
ncbi:MAG: hypothetical protein NWF04_03150 [Candidatus Bathyarchaeota archaeon]|nr:hypothetical protein [Candidatus Bathyarchaeota archaeon]